MLSRGKMKLNVYKSMEIYWKHLIRGSDSNYKFISTMIFLFAKLFHKWVPLVWMKSGWLSFTKLHALIIATILGDGFGLHWLHLVNHHI